MNENMRTCHEQGKQNAASVEHASCHQGKYLINI